MGDGKALAHGYRTLQNWDKWLAQEFLGNKVLNAEKEIISDLIKQHYGKHAVLMGVPQQQALLTTTNISIKTLVSPLLSATKDFLMVESNFAELAIQTGSVDLVILPHILEFVDNPRALLAEACRIVKPEGLIVICHFNPYSTWGFKRIVGKQHHHVVRTSHHFIASHLVKNWLELASFEIEAVRSGLYTPPIQHKGLYNRLHFCERIGALFFPKAGAVNVIVARAKVIPLTPIKMKWKQKLDNIRIAKPIPGSIASS